MRAASRLNVAHTASHIRTKLHCLGANLCRPGSHVRSAKQLTWMTRPAPAAVAAAAARRACQPGTPRPIAATASAPAAGTISHLAHTGDAKVYNNSTASERLKLLTQVEPGRPVSSTATSQCVDQPSSSSSSSSTWLKQQQQQQQGRTALSSARASQLSTLQALLGYTFRDITLLDQACTHDPSGTSPSYRELAFVGDAALWLLFAEHAVRSYGCAGEDPISGAWPAHLSRLLSRANCAATARQWGLAQYLQHSSSSSSSTTPTAHGSRNQALSASSAQQQECVDAEGRLMVQDSLPSDITGDSLMMHLQLHNSHTVIADLEENDSSSSSSSSSLSSSSSSSSLSRTSSSSSSLSNSGSSRGMYGGVWGSDALAEMFEGVVGALLLDCGSDYETLKQLLLPWVAASIDASKAEAAAAAQAVAAAGPAPVVVSPPAAAVLTGKLAALPAVAAAARGSHVADGTLQAAGSSVQQQLQGLQTALEQQLLRHCGLRFDSPAPLAAASQHMLTVMRTGESVAEAETLKFLGFSLLQFAAALQAYCRQQGLHAWPGADTMMGPDAWCGGWQRDNGSSSSSSSVDSSGSSSSSSGGRKGQAVHQMSQHAKELTTVRHRAKMWLLLLEGTAWAPAGGSYLTAVTWKKQKQALARCLDLLLAAVYLDSGLPAALGLAGVLIQTTPPTTHDKSWMPAWARNQNSRAADAMQTAPGLPGH